MMQIYASAARLRSSGVPNLDNGMKAIGVREQPATSDRLWQIVAYKRRLAKT
jgi:hypothetical protein